MPERLDTGERRAPGLSTGPATARPAAVLVLIVPLDAAIADGPGAGPDADPEAGVVLIRRVDRGGHHSGDVALPGGRVEIDDPSPAAAALREAAEEVGLDAVAAGVRIVGELEPFWIPVSDYRVSPVVAIAERMPVLSAAPAEVEAVVTVPLGAFLPDAPIELVETTVRGFPLRFGAYPVAGLRVWGATARILGQLGAVLDGA